MSYDPTGDVADINSGDTTWVLTSTAIIFMMTPALAFFYGGLVARKNLINTLMLTYICVGVVTIQWFLIGFSFSFEHGTTAWGSFKWSALHRWGLGPIGDAPTVSGYAFFTFQLSTAIVTPALISGAIIGRMKLQSYVLFVFLWTTAVYDGLAHWIWAEGGWLRHLGVIDLAGGVVIHTSAGVSALVACIMLGKRKDKESSAEDEEKNLPYTLLGTGLLWVGWSGFNAGAVFFSNGRAALAFTNTNIGAAAGMVMWIVLDVLAPGGPKKIKMTGASIGCLVGLISVTAGCGFYQPGWALVVGLLTTAVSWFLTGWFHRLGSVDDTLDVFTCHGVGGMLGTLFLGLFAEMRLGGADGSFYGNDKAFGYQLTAVAVGAAYSAGCTYGILKLVDWLLGLRVDEETEVHGLDTGLHSEAGFVGTAKKSVPHQHGAGAVHQHGAGAVYHLNAQAAKGDTMEMISMRTAAAVPARESSQVMLMQV